MNGAFHLSKKRLIALTCAWLAVLSPILLFAAAFMAQEEPQIQSAAGEAEQLSDSVQLLKDLQAQHKIIDVHEHLGSAPLASMYARLMDELGVGRMMLMGSSKFTFTMDESSGFTGYDQNNQDLLKVIKKYPGRFEAWTTINPQDPDKIAKFAKAVERGASGLKLYLGNGYVTHEGRYMFHTIAMDDPSMAPLYAYCQEHFLPLCFHVNPSEEKPGFAEEFIAVLSAYPDLKVIAPHYLLSSIQSTRLEEFLDTFPNLYSDISLGESFVAAGLQRISENPSKFRHLFEQYPDRFMYGADLVLVNVRGKGEQWIRAQWNAYFDMLTRPTYATPLLPGQTLHGLALSPDLLERVLYKNFEEFSAKRPVGTRITRTMDFTRMEVTPTLRKPGQMFPPRTNINAAER